MSQINFPAAPVHKVYAKMASSERWRWFKPEYMRYASLTSPGKNKEEKDEE